MLNLVVWAGQRSRYSDCLRAGRSGDRIPVGRDFPHLSRPALRATQSPVQWVPGFFPGVRYCRGVTLTPYPFQCRGLKQSRAIPLLSLRDFVACERVKPYLNFVVRKVIGRLKRLKIRKGHVAVMTCWYNTSALLLNFSYATQYMFSTW